MNWLVVIGFVALFALILSGVVLVLVAKRRKIEPLPDGDYVVTIVETRETPRGKTTVFRVDEPEEFKGQTVTIVKEKASDGT